MQASLHAPFAPGKTLGVWVCLVAALLLWSPLWATAWHANAMACCSGTQCPVHGKSSSHKDHGSPAPAESESSMECHHAGKSSTGMMTCAMSCCQDHEQSVTGAVVFVLPDSVKILSAANVVAALSLIDASAPVVLFEPLSPPPRSIHFSS